ncbi:hypothetical protein [Methylomonas sp. MgM2]
MERNRPHDLNIQAPEFNDGFPAMNLKNGRSLDDPFLTIALLQSGRSPKHRFSGFASTKQPFVGSGSRPITGP